MRFTRRSYLHKSILHLALDHPRRKLELHRCLTLRSTLAGPRIDQRAAFDTTDCVDETLGEAEHVGETSVMLERLDMRINPFIATQPRFTVQSVDYCTMEVIKRDISWHPEGGEAKHCAFRRGRSPDFQETGLDEFRQLRSSPP